MMKVFIKGFLLGFLTYCAATWAYTFAQILIHGSITYVEPNIPVLITDLIVAILVTIGGIILILERR